MSEVERLFIFPQYPTKMRYQEWWYWYLPKRFDEYFDEVIIVSPNIDMFRRSKSDMFSPIDDAIDFEVMQIKEYLRYDVKDADYLFVADISFAGILPTVFYHKRKGKKFAYCHATSLNKFDYFASMRNSKWFVERGFFRIFDKVFVGTGYHKLKIIRRDPKIENIYVVGLPRPPFRTYKERKEYDILYSGRRTHQKFSEHIWMLLKDENYDMRMRLFDSWEEYYKGLSKAKIVLLMSKEETFGYQVMEAIMNNSVVIAPKCCSFSELLSEKYLYENVFELKEKVAYFVEHYDEVPRMKEPYEEYADNWFENVYKLMVENNDRGDED